MQSWNQWSSSGSGYPPPLLPSSNSAQAGQRHNQSDSSIDPQMSNMGYNMYCPPGIMPEMNSFSHQQQQQQWSIMQQQNWQQWQTWQQQYQQWHLQYGDKYNDALAMHSNQVQQQQMHPAIPPLDRSVPPPPINNINTNDSQPPPLPVQPPLPASQPPPPPPPPTAPPPPLPVPPPEPVSAPPPSTHNSSSEQEQAKVNTSSSSTTLTTTTTTTTSTLTVTSSSSGSPAPSKGEIPFSEPETKRTSLKFDMNKQGNGKVIKGKSPNKNKDEPSEAEKQFDITFQKWEDQFNNWKAQNANHPDKAQYREYEQKWESWREQLLDRREAMRKKRENTQKSQAGPAASKPQTSIKSDSPSNSETTNLDNNELTSSNQTSGDKKKTYVHDPHNSRPGGDGGEYHSNTFGENNPRPGFMNFQVNQGYHAISNNQKNSSSTDRDHHQQQQQKQQQQQQQHPILDKFNSLENFNPQIPPPNHPLNKSLSEQGSASLVLQKTLDKIELEKDNRENENSEKDIQIISSNTSDGTFFLSPCTDAEKSDSIPGLDLISTSEEPNEEERPPDKGNIPDNQPEIVTTSQEPGFNFKALRRNATMSNDNTVGPSPPKKQAMDNEINDDMVWTSKPPTTFVNRPPSLLSIRFNDRPKKVNYTPQRDVDSQFNKTADLMKNTNFSGTERVHKVALLPTPFDVPNFNDERLINTKNVEKTTSEAQQEQTSNNQNPLSCIDVSNVYGNSNPQSNTESPANAAFSKPMDESGPPSFHCPPPGLGALFGLGPLPSQGPPPSLGPPPGQGPPPSLGRPPPGQGPPPSLGPPPGQGPPPSQGPPPGQGPPPSQGPLLGHAPPPGQDTTGQGNQEQEHRTTNTSIPPPNSQFNNQNFPPPFVNQHCPPPFGNQTSFPPPSLHPPPLDRFGNPIRPLFGPGAEPFGNTRPADRFANQATDERFNNSTQGFPDRFPEEERFSIQGPAGDRFQSSFDRFGNSGPGNSGPGPGNCFNPINRFGNQGERFPGEHFGSGNSGPGNRFGNQEPSQGFDRFRNPGQFPPPERFQGTPYPNQGPPNREQENTSRFSGPNESSDKPDEPMNRFPGPEDRFERFNSNDQYNSFDRFGPGEERFNRFGPNPINFPENRFAGGFNERPPQDTMQDRFQPPPFNDNNKDRFQRPPFQPRSDTDYRGTNMNSGGRFGGGPPSSGGFGSQGPRFDPPPREEDRWGGNEGGIEKWASKDNETLKPTTVVDYGHKPVDSKPIGLSDYETTKVQTFDYGHGSKYRGSDANPKEWIAPAIVVDHATGGGSGGNFQRSGPSKPDWISKKEDRRGFDFKRGGDRHDESNDYQRTQRSGPPPSAPPLRDRYLFDTDDRPRREDDRTRRDDDRPRRDVDDRIDSRIPTRRDRGYRERPFPFENRRHDSSGPPFENRRHDSSGPPFENRRHDSSGPPFENRRHDSSGPPFENRRHDSSGPPFENRRHDSSGPPFEHRRHDPNGSPFDNRRHDPPVSSKDDSEKEKEVIIPETPPPPPINTQVLVEDLLSKPGRDSRPQRIVIILRGPPGSGKSYVAKLIKDKEVEQGGSAPRILCLDDYFMTEVEKEEEDEETGRKVTKKVMEYEYEYLMEEHYRSSLVKAFRKTINDGYFQFIIVDCVNECVEHFEEMWNHAKQKVFQVYIVEMDMEISTCFKRNVHHRTEREIEDLVKKWQPTPKQMLRLDVRSLLQAEAITEVEMEDSQPESTSKTISDDENTSDSKAKTEEEDMTEDQDNNGHFYSKWDSLETSGETLNRLDGLARRKRSDDNPKTLEDWLQLSDDYEERSSTPGKKRIRWADIEEKRQQEKMRAIGFVVGQTDWSRMTDPTLGESALTQTKYI